jgi:hypothetical protein
MRGASTNTNTDTVRLASMNPSVQAQIHVITSTAEVVMLQWTCRLRVALERSGFRAIDLENNSRPECLTEAEFVAPNGGFPSDFRWGALQSCYRDRESDTAGKVTPDGRVDFDILWLSPTVFICSLEFERQGDYLPNDCQIAIGLNVENDEKIFQFNAYSLSSLFPGELDEPSLLPFQFLQHVTALLPVNYFDEILLFRLCRHRCPIDHMLQFLAIVPSDGDMARAASADCGTEFIFDCEGCTFTVDELKAVFSHPFHPSVKLGFGCHPFDESVPMIEMLKLSMHLRSIDIPEHLFGMFLHEGPRVNFSVRSSNLTMHGTSALNGDNCTPTLLGTIATIHDVGDICLRGEPCGTAAQKLVLECCIRPFVNGSLKSKSLRVHLVGDEGVRLHESEIKEWAAALSVSCKSKELQKFNVCFYPAPNHRPRKLDKVKQWDAEIMPSLVLNYCGENLTRPLEGKILPVSVKAINQGMVYHKTTGHDPFDMRIANAGLIYALLRTKAGETQGVGDWHDVFSRLAQDASGPLCKKCTFSGSKRPAQSLQE